jgi:hypothetical protein
MPSDAVHPGLSETEGTGAGAGAVRQGRRLQAARPAAERGHAPPAERSEAVLIKTRGGLVSDAENVISGYRLETLDRAVGT